LPSARQKSSPDAPGGGFLPERRDKRATSAYITGQTLSILSKAGPPGPLFCYRIRAVSVLAERIEKLVAPAIEAAGFELVRIRLTGNEMTTLQIMAERPDHSMSAGECARLSRILSPILEEADPIAGPYRLEVSSPGIDRPLVRLRDYVDWQGYEAKVELDRMIEGQKKFKGVLAGVDGDNICLDIEGEEETALIPFAWIAAAKLTLTDELIRESLKAAKEAARKTRDEDPGFQDPELPDAELHDHGELQ
jgi:ribosome maturation factor RimP